VIGMVYYLSAGHENPGAFGLCAAFSRLNGELLIKSLNSWLNVFLNYGNAAERNPSPWIGAAKSTYINLWP
jgi:hypothetical protein